MSRNSHYCNFCRCSFPTENELRKHKGVIHKNTLARKLEAAERKLFVRGFQSILYPKESLFDYFSQFGSVNSVTLHGQSGPGYIVVEFKETEPVARALSAVHRLFGVTLKVHRFKCQLQPGEEKKLAQEELERMEEQKYLDNLNDVQERLLTGKSLADQMSMVADMFRLDQMDKQARAGICKEISKIFAPYFENCRVLQFGSSMNGFGSKGCDLDIFLYIDTRYDSDDSTPLTKVKQMTKTLSACNNFTNVMTIPSMRCPLVRFVHRTSGIKCDLSLNNRKALYNSHLLRLYGSDQRVHRLVSNVRLWARSQGLTGGVTGGCLFTSYATTMIVLFFLMQRRPRIIPRVCDIASCVKDTQKEVVDGWECLRLPLDAKLPPTDNKESDVELLRDFFQFFSNAVDWDNDVLVMRNAKIVSRREIQENPVYNGIKIGCMMVIDPFVLQHNVVSNVNEAIKTRFVKMLQRAAELTCHWPISVPLEQDLPWGVGAILTPAPKIKPKLRTRNPEGKKKKKKQGGKEVEPDADGELSDGEFIMSLRPLPGALLDPGLLALAERNCVRPGVQWCALVQEMIITVLGTVFMVEVDEVDVEGVGEKGTPAVDVEKVGERGMLGADVEVDEVDVEELGGKEKAERVGESDMPGVDTGVVGERAMPEVDVEEVVSERGMPAMDVGVVGERGTLAVEVVGERGTSAVDVEVVGERGIPAVDVEEVVSERGTPAMDVEVVGERGTPAVDVDGIGEMNVEEVCERGLGHGLRNTESREVMNL